MYSIYKITNKDDGRVYVGSTKQPLAWRYTQHKSKQKRGDMSACSTTSFNFDNCSIECLEKMDGTFDEVRMKEREYCENLNAMNKRKPIETREETYKRQKETCLKNGWFENYTCACGKTLQKIGKNRHERSKRHQKFLNYNI